MWFKSHPLDHSGKLPIVPQHFEATNYSMVVYLDQAVRFKQEHN